MRAVHHVCAAALIAALTATATAQTNAPDPAPAPVPDPAVAAAQPPATTSAKNFGLIQSHWTVAGFVGSNVGTVAGNPRFSDDRNFNVGGQIGYLWHGVIGAELLSDFAPSFKTSSAVLADNPGLYTYMANGITAIPLGPSGNIQPYGSGGYGGIQMHANVISVAVPTPTDAPDKISATTTTSSNRQMLSGWNAGGGIMAFAGPFGVRGDVRYYKAKTDTSATGSDADLFVKSLLSGLSFWRTNVGVAFRW